MESLSLAFSSGWASGVNAYLVVLVLGIADRVGDFAGIPDVLGRWDVLAVAGFMYAMEFVADKIPYVDSTWDVISTAIRPTVGAVIGVLLAGDATTLDQAVLGVVGGGTALLSHLVKAGEPAGDQLLPRAGHQHRRQRHRGRRRPRRGVVRDRAPPGRRGDRRGAPAVGLMALVFLGRLVRRGWRRWKGRDPVPAPGGLTTTTSAAPAAARAGHGP